MPILNLRLTNSDGTNRCQVTLPHSIRTQEMRLKGTRVHHNGFGGGAPTLRTAMVLFPFFSGIEVTSNVAGGQHVPAPVVTGAGKTSTESNVHAALLAEEVPAEFVVALFRDDGVTPLLVTNAADDDNVSEINVLFEYSTNNKFF